MRSLSGESGERGGADLAVEIATFERSRERLKEHPDDHWVLVQGTVLIGVYQTFDEGYAVAVAHCREKPFLLRQVRPEPLMLPGSLLLHEQSGAEDRPGR